MKKTLIIIVLLSVIVAAIAGSINISLKNKDNVAQTVRYTAETAAADEVKISNTQDRTKTYITAEEGAEGTGIIQNICGDRRACNYDSRAQSVYHNSCVFAVYDMAFGSRNARTCQPSKPNAELEIPSNFSPIGSYPASGRTCSVSPDVLNVHIHEWSYDNYGNLASNANYFIGTRSGYYLHTDEQKKQDLTDDIKEWQGKNACKQLKEFKDEQAAAIKKTGKATTGATAPTPEVVR